MRWLFSNYLFFSLAPSTALADLWELEKLDLERYPYARWSIILSLQVFFFDKKNSQLEPNKNKYGDFYNIYFFPYRCLDGTAGGFWFYQGFGSGRKKFIIHHQGGGWCTTVDDCFDRSKSFLGSSESWRNSADCQKSLEKNPAQSCYFDGGDDGKFHMSSYYASNFL